MKKIKLQLILSPLLLLAVMSSCLKKDDPTPEEKPEAERKGLYVLSEGNFNANNASLTYYDFESKEAIADRFTAQNNRGLGSVANDIAVYGSKMYIVVNVSSTVEVVNAGTAKLIKQVEVKDKGVGRQPRNIVFHKNKAYISSFDGTVAVLDTGSLLIEKYITVGKNPEQLAVSNGKLYVANSGGLDFPNYDSTVSVVSLETLAEITKVKVGVNPSKVSVDKYGDVYVLAAGNYGDAPATLTIINDKTNLVKSQIPFSGGSFVISGDRAYVTTFDGKIKVFNVNTETLEKENFISDGTVITAPYGISIDEISGEVFVADAKNFASNGEVVCLSKDGVRRYSIPTGISPNKVVFVNK